MKRFQQIECGYFLVGVAAILVSLYLTPPGSHLLRQIHDGTLLIGCVAYCSVPVSFIVHAFIRERLNLRRWLWLWLIVADIVTIVILALSPWADIAGNLFIAGLIVLPALYVLICISETWLPWLNHTRIKAFIKDLAV